MRGAPWDVCAKAGPDWGSFFRSGMSLETKLPDLVVLLLLPQYPPGAPSPPAPPQQVHV